MSRLPSTEYVCVKRRNFLHHITPPVTPIKVGQATNKKLILSNMRKHCGVGWLKKCSAKVLKPFFGIRDRLSVKEGVLLYGKTVVIPQDLQPKELSILHHGHGGVVCSHMLASSYFVSKPKMLVTKVPGKNPWEWIHLELFQLNSVHYLILCYAPFSGAYWRCFQDLPFRIQLCVILDPNSVHKIWLIFLSIIFYKNNQSLSKWVPGHIMQQLGNVVYRIKLDEGRFMRVRLHQLSVNNCKATNMDECFFMPCPVLQPIQDEKKGCKITQVSQGEE
ncbi:hypothetical protein PR048_031739 [Dryococelus australis]|uniref:Uncharacterized protein n=1 Tax=Dryococelus australis TaxID=614101 RepID=A0ABQ9G646_9NEOP|nr:hypothetical protein PR048_031739 [Dryococelus australis]